MKTRALIAIAVAMLAAVGCGSNDEGKPIPASIRRQLDVRLGEAQRRLDDGSLGACEDITDDTDPAVQRILDRVPDDVDADVRDALNEGFAHLFELVSQRCQDLKGRTDTQPDTTEETTPPDTTTEETTPPETNTTPPETNTTPTTPTTPTTTPGNGNGNGGSGNGNGNGNGGVGNGGVELPGGGGATTPGNP